ncbi:ATPase associated with various cellular activities AAA_5 [Oscillatoria nigro-viridis PCC 7112]|uniref:ATPase associated with various cellular activities AAA_5 n=1 Tax=Phormidium nigroviride PCC 7112 TaxID=179408 RepID=K9VRA4_9CYAN|nr:AAA family ATPase [Oscillatoria nigro-viridis]AFZ10064.1 ATPase associated with various cellular activities AAA_5 [Oscillatoria nigro-viridis PCC 7112]
MEKVFVHPECPFSVNTFNLLEKFYEDPSSDFYMAHHKDFLKYVEEPLKYIFSQVEELLPDYIKNNIYIRWDRFGYFTEKDSSQSIIYNIALDCQEINSLDRSQLMLRLENHKLIFGFEVHNYYLIDMLNNYKCFLRDKLDAREILARYKLPNKHHCSFTLKIIRGNSEAAEFSSSIILKNQKTIYELLENMYFYCYGQTKPTHKVRKTITNIQLAISLEAEGILGSSVKQLIHQIAQTFKKVFPLLLISYYDDEECHLYDTRRFDDAKDNFLLYYIREYLSVYEKEFNPVHQLEEISQTTGFQTTKLTQWIHAINRKGQAIIQGPPGTGKTFIAEKLAKHLIGGGDGFSDIIQFHPAYTYEDFIEGLRPITQNGQLTYSIVPGRFLEFCEKAEAREDTCVLIIDEINRANLSQVFGELMYLLDDRQDTARFITLASGKLFRIPTNVRIIGTMNTADRSIALVDNALRRRFAFIPVYPNYEVLRQYHHREKTGFPVDKLTSILKDVNRAINNKHYELGISFFLTKTLAEDIQDIWQMEIEPYLEEYFFDNQAKMNEFLWKKIKDKLSKS